MSGSVRVGIIGGGISGLTVAFYLEKVCQNEGIELDLELLEATDRLGGVIRSERVGEFLLESGPEAWASYKPAAKSLIAELKLSSEVIGSNDYRRKTFVLRNGRLEALPDGMTFFAPVDPISFWRTAPLSLQGKFRASLEPFVPRSRGDLSVRDFFERRLGSEFTDRMVEPLLSAIYGARLDQLSAPSTMPELYGAEQRRGSLWKGLRRLAKLSTGASVLVTLKGGMGDLVERLRQRLQLTRVRLGVGEIRVDRQEGRYRVMAPAYEALFDRLVFCTPANVTAKLLGDEVPELKSVLNEIPYSSSTIVYLGYKKSEFSHPLDGFGFVVPISEGRIADACTWVSSKFDHRCPEDKVLLRCAIHSGRKKLALGEDHQLIKEVHAELSAIMGFRCTPIFSHVYHVGRVIPQLLVGHLERLRMAREALREHPQIHLAGSYCGGVGVPDCIKTGRVTAEQVIAHLRTK